VERQLAATCAMVTALVPALEVPAAKVAARIHRRLEEVAGGGTAVLVHGDFSADQVLVSGAEVRLIDFDRARAGAAEADLGSFAAVEEMSRWRGTAARTPRTGDLIDGYGRAGGRFMPEATDAWAALRLFAGSVDPFRDRSPDWAADMSRHIDRAGELVP
jgi:aminoglycoside phosphotransferase (APT) family kinase protein